MLPLSISKQDTDERASEQAVVLLVSFVRHCGLPLSLSQRER